MPSPPDIRLLVTTFSKEEEATEIVRTLVREQLVACGTLLRGARSIYVWQENLVDSDEIVVTFKTTASAAPAAAARLKQLHSYDVPEILLFDVESSNPAYTQWVNENVA